MKKITLHLSALLMLFAVSPLLHSYDFGLMLNQSVGFGGGGDSETGIENYSAILVPRFQALFGDSGDLYISAGAAVTYENEEWNFIPKLLRTDFLWRNGSGFKIRVGRMAYEDPLDFIAAGLFDGTQVLFDTAKGTLSAGVWYTGLLYKKDANITMTGDDFKSYNAPIAKDAFLDTYFASRRVMTALGWEHPGLSEFIRLRLALSGQFDVNDTDTPFHSQYVSVKASMPFKRMVFELGGGVQLAQAKEDADSAFELGIGFAGEAGLSWTLPTSFHSRLLFSALFSSGTIENSRIHAFVPVTTKEQGDILKAKLSGLSVLKLDYTARLHQSISAGVSSSYFVRSDLGTYGGYPLGGVLDSEEENKGYFLGNEFAGRIIWSAASDIFLDIGAGVFVPSLGNAAPDAKPKWHIEAGLVIALY